MYHVKDGIKRAYQEHDDLLILALTGRTGSGCTTAANILSKDLNDIAFVPSDAHQPEQRKLKIIEAFAQHHWQRFNVISVSAVIFSFIAEKPVDETVKFISDLTGKSDGDVRQRIKPAFETIKKSNASAKIFEKLVAQSKMSVAEKIDAQKHLEEILKKGAEQLRKSLKDDYHKVLQKVGDNLRISGKPFEDEIEPNNLFELTKRISIIIDLYRDLDKQNKRGTRIAIDAIRNPLELVYLRDRYSPLLTIAITADNEERHDRLSRINYSEAQISELDNKEYPEDKKHLDSYETFVSQNLQYCIQKSDIFIHNRGKPGGDIKQKTKSLSSQLVRYICLALHPGLVTPTRDERCMQIAFVSKVNSGCISRQVGAVVADRNFSIKSVGWNDVAKGQIPCSIRDVSSLVSGKDDEAFSSFELNNEDFRKHVIAQNSGRSELSGAGLPCPFCFKDAYNTRNGKNEKNQVHTRSLHAEENAFLQLAKYGNSAIDGGFLYTTASPCELCSKKAFQLGIKEVVYIDPYPGISSSHILASGPEHIRPKVRLFSGAVGGAYHRLYDPILPIKDEYRARMGHTQANDMFADEDSEHQLTSSRDGNR